MGCQTVKPCLRNPTTAIPDQIQNPDKKQTHASPGFGSQYLESFAGFIDFSLLGCICEPPLWEQLNPGLVGVEFESF